MYQIEADSIAMPSPGGLDTDFGFEIIGRFVPAASNQTTITPTSASTATAGASEHAIHSTHTTSLTSKISDSLSSFLHLGSSSASSTSTTAANGATTTTSTASSTGPSTASGNSRRIHFVFGCSSSDVANGWLGAVLHVIACVSEQRARDARAQTNQAIRRSLSLNTTILNGTSTNNANGSTQSSVYSTRTHSLVPSLTSSKSNSGSSTPTTTTTTTSTGAAATAVLSPRMMLLSMNSNLNSTSTTSNH
jgi:hypothetical protein